MTIWPIFVTAFCWTWW